MKENSYKRRELLKEAGIAGMIAGSIPVLSQESKATQAKENTVDKSTVPFFEFAVTLTDELSAPKTTACRQFPSFIPAERDIYLTKDHFTFEGGDHSDAVVATQEGFHLIGPREEINYSWLPLSDAPVGRGTFVRDGKINANMLVESFGAVVEVNVDGETLRATPGETDSFDHKCEIEYTDDTGRKKQEERAIQVFLRNHGVSKMFSHEELVLIPQNSEQGFQIRKMVSEQTNHDLGNWKKVYDLASANAWGIELEGMEDHQ